MCKDSNDTVARQPYLSTLVTTGPRRAARASLGLEASVELREIVTPFTIGQDNGVDVKRTERLLELQRLVRDAF